MSAKEPSKNNPEQISLNMKASTGETQEQPAPPLSTGRSLDQRAFKQEPSVEDQDRIPSEQTEVATKDDIALSQQAESAFADTAETNTSSAVVSSQSGFFSRPRSKKWRVFWVSLVLLLLISTVTAIIIVPRLYRIDIALKSATNQALPHVKITEQVIDIPSPTSLPKDLADLGHLNLLLLASDTDSKFEGGRVLTQTDIVVRIDFTHHHVTMLSLPRDLWIPSDEGYCCNKLDAHLAL